MKKMLLAWLPKLINWFQRRLDKANNSTQDNLPYTPLSPIGNADINNDYQKALDWALKDREKNDIKNIALTGPYGSGKSSILKTYIGNYSGNDLHFLHISLATFKEEEEDENQASKTELLRLIELSILQQVFYHEKDSSIPDSRFRKIKNYTRKNLLVTTFVIILLIASIFQLIYPTLFEHLLKIDFSKITSTAVHYTSLVLSVWLGSLLIYRSIRILNSVKLSKLNFQNAEIEIGDDVSKSILNHHIDEILYFFEVTKYNVVIIEDLDRFKQTEIFTKLREINLLINNSKKIKKDVVFIYAVRDDMFKEHNERTKFFDFIIPVIPVINPSNSSEKLLEKQLLNKYSISESLIDSISLFIDDMRLLHNITNEFYLYRQKLNQSLNQDKLLAMIVYKNIFPNDFAKLSNNDGILYYAIDNKQQYIKSENQKIDEEIENRKNEIKRLGELKLEKVQELRYLYLLFYSTSLHGFISFHLDEVDLSPVQMATDKNFDFLIKNRASYTHVYYSSRNISLISTKFSEIEKKVDKDKQYSERKKEIDDWTNNKSESLKREIQSLEKDKSRTRSLRIRELLGRGQPLNEIENVKQKNLINVLLRNAFIDEDYLDYVTLFYEGSITKNDHQFLINVKSQIPTDFNYKLNKIDKLIKKIGEFEFDKKFTLNYSLLDFLLKNDNHDQICSLCFSKLKDESVESIEFIDGYLDVSTNIERFIKLLIQKWDNIWSFLESKSNFTKERKGIYFKYIIEYAALTDMEKLYQAPIFREYLLRRSDFLNLISDIGRLKSIIELLDIKFKRVDFSQAPSELIDHIYDNNCYEINIYNIKSLLSMRGEFNETDFVNKNFFSIKNSKCNRMLEYLIVQIDEYVENIYLKVEPNYHEPEDLLIELLNNPNLSDENKLGIIKITSTKIDDIFQVQDVGIIDYLLEHSKITPKWDNVLYCFELNESKLSASAIAFIENEGNAVALSRERIKQDSDKDSTNRTFMRSLIQTVEFDDKIYTQILSALSYTFTIDLNALSKAKVALLIKKRILTFNTKNYEAIKKSFSNLHIEFLETHKTEFLKDISKFEIDSNDVFKILESATITRSEKNRLIELFNDELISTNKNSLRMIGLLILKDNSFRVSDSILKLILVCTDLSIEQRIRIHNWKHGQISESYYESFLNSLKEPYSDITINGKRPVLHKTEYNEKLAAILMSKEYISKYEIDDKRIRISTFRKSNEP